MKLNLIDAALVAIFGFSLGCGAVYAKSRFNKDDEARKLQVLKDASAQSAKSFEAGIAVITRVEQELQSQHAENIATLVAQSQALLLEVAEQHRQRMASEGSQHNRLMSVTSQGCSDMIDALKDTFMTPQERSLVDVQMRIRKLEHPE